MAIVAFHLRPSTFFLGWTRADLFFVLSGYLITVKLISQELSGGRVLAFWIRRGLRIWPAYYVLIVIAAIIQIGEGHAIELDRLITYLTFTQNVSHYWSTMTYDGFGSASQTWSLAIEQQFYVIWPVAIVVGGRRRIRFTATWMLLNSVLARVVGLYPEVALARADGLALGAILAVALGSDKSRSLYSPRLLRSLLVAGLGGIGLVVAGAGCANAPLDAGPTAGSLAILGVNLAYMSLIGLLVCYREHPVLKPARWPVLCYLGRISYGIYLYNILIIDLIRKLTGYQTPTTDFAAAALTVAVAAISWQYIEQPIGAGKYHYRFGRGRGLSDR